VTIEAGKEALLQAVLPVDPMRRLVSSFYEDTRRFAGTTFLGLEVQQPDRIEASDLLAVTLMGEIFPALAVRELLDGKLGDEVGALLTDIPTKTGMWNVSVEDLHDKDKAPSRLWYQLLQLYDVGPTKVSKLMARKRPALIPIFDSVIGERIATGDDYWYAFHAFLSDDANRSAVEELRPEGTTADELPTLRLLDTAVWMRYSQGKSAQEARDNAGI
jgi:hypothetical protein